MTDREQTRREWPEPETTLDIAERKLRDYRGGAVLSDAEADALLIELAALRAGVDTRPIAAADLDRAKQFVRDSGWIK